MLTVGSIAVTAGCLRLSEETSGGTDGNATSNAEQDDANDSTEDTDSNGEENADSNNGGQQASGIDVISQVGQVDEDGEQIVTIELTVGRSPGSGDVDLSAMTAQFVSPTGSVSLVHASEGEPAFYLQPIVAENGNDATLSADSDRYAVVIPLMAGDPDQLAASDPVEGTTAADNGSLSPLEAGESASLQMTLANGASREERLTVPDTLSGNTGGAVQL